MDPTKVEFQASFKAYVTNLSEKWVRLVWVGAQEVHGKICAIRSDYFVVIDKKGEYTVVPFRSIVAVGTGPAIDNDVDIFLLSGVQ